MGWYRGADGGVRSKGVFYFVLAPQGTEAIGRWVGMSMDGSHPHRERFTRSQRRARTEQILQELNAQEVAA